MLYIADKVVAAGRLADVITMASVVDMFSVVATEFGGARNSQKKWLTIAQEIQRRPKQWQWGKCFLVYERRLQQQQKLNGQWMSGWWWGVMVDHMLSWNICQNPNKN